MYIYVYTRSTAQLTSRHCILNIYSTNILNEYFKHAAHSPFFFSSRCRLFHNAIFFGSCNIHILNAGRAKILKKIPTPKGWGISPFLDPDNKINKYEFTEMKAINIMRFFFTFGRGRTDKQNGTFEAWKQSNSLLKLKVLSHTKHSVFPTKTNQLIHVKEVFFFFLLQTHETRRFTASAKLRYFKHYKRVTTVVERIMGGIYRFLKQ
jgi:hypothetical protein